MSKIPRQGSVSYKLSPFDIQLVDATRDFLRKVVSSTKASPAQLVSVAKLLHGIDHLPRQTGGQKISVTVIGPRRRYGQIETYYWWDVKQSDLVFEVSSGGHYYDPSTGGDTFSVFSWQVAPGAHGGDYIDYREHLSVVPDVEQYETAVTRMNLREPGYSISVSDDDNDLLNEAEEALEGSIDADDDTDDVGADDDEPPAEWTVFSVNEVEMMFINDVDFQEADKHEPQFAYGIDDCGECGRDLSTCGLAVDGRLKGSAMWGNFCAECYHKIGSGIGWGHGQLYARQANGDWRLIAGFQK